MTKGLKISLLINSEVTCLFTSFCSTVLSITGFLSSSWSHLRAVGAPHAEAWEMGCWQHWLSLLVSLLLGSKISFQNPFFHPPLSRIWTKLGYGTKLCFPRRSSCFHKELLPRSGLGADQWAVDSTSKMHGADWKIMWLWYQLHTLSGEFWGSLDKEFSEYLSRNTE